MWAGRKEGAKFTLDTVYIYSLTHFIVFYENETRLEIPTLPNI